MSYVPDKYMDDVIHFFNCQIQWLRHEGIRNAKAIRNQKLKNESVGIKNRLIAKIGECEVCGFSYKPILQIHHIVPISEFGNNQPENVICVCPNCHKTLHHLYSQLKRNRNMDFGLIKTHNPGVADGITDVLVRYIVMKGEIIDYFESIGFVDTSEE